MAERHDSPGYILNVGPEAEQELLRQAVSHSNGYSLPAFIRRYKSVMEPSEVRLIEKAIASMAKRLAPVVAVAR